MNMSELPARIGTPALSGIPPAPRPSGIDLAAAQRTLEGKGTVVSPVAQRPEAPSPFSPPARRVVVSSTPDVGTPRAAAAEPGQPPAEKPTVPSQTPSPASEAARTDLPVARTNETTTRDTTASPATVYVRETAGGAAEKDVQQQTADKDSTTGETTRSKGIVSEETRERISKGMQRRHQQDVAAGRDTSHSDAHNAAIGEGVRRAAAARKESGLPLTPRTLSAETRAAIGAAARERHQRDVAEGRDTSHSDARRAAISAGVKRAAAERRALREASTTPPTEVPNATSSTRETKTGLTVPEAGLRKGLNHLITQYGIDGVKDALSSIEHLLEHPPMSPDDRVGPQVKAVLKDNHVRIIDILENTGISPASFFRYLAGRNRTLSSPHDLEAVLRASGLDPEVGRGKEIMELDSYQRLLMNTKRHKPR